MTTLAGRRLGRLDQDARVLASLAFDLRGVNLRTSTVMAARLQCEYPCRAGDTLAQVRVLDVTTEFGYGSCRIPTGQVPTRLDVALHQQALRDLQLAAGGTFWVHQELLSADEALPSLRADSAARLVLELADNAAEEMAYRRTA